MYLSDLYTLTDNLLGEQMDRGVLVSLYNDALNRLSPDLYLPATKTTTSVGGQSAYTFSSAFTLTDVRTVLNVLVDNAPLLALGGPEEVITEFSEWPNVAGTPTHYYVTPTGIYLLPPPDTDHADLSIDLHYLRNPVLLSSVGDPELQTVDLPHEFATLPVYYAAWCIRNSDGQTGLAAVYQFQFEVGALRVQEATSRRGLGGYFDTRDALPKQARRSRSDGA